jgi:hypothetical protein
MTIALYHYFAFLYSLICLLICPSRIKPSRALDPTLQAPDLHLSVTLYHSVQRECLL